MNEIEIYQEWNKSNIMDENGKLKQGKRRNKIRMENCKKGKINIRFDNGN